MWTDDSCPLPSNPYRAPRLIERYAAASRKVTRRRSGSVSIAVPSMFMAGPFATVTFTSVTEAAFAKAQHPNSNHARNRVDSRVRQCMIRCAIAWAVASATA